jgi:excisionase family DNA binding protein
MNNDILTTSETAKLLGISVRTAQLLIESGSLDSWKTPGGHRRVYRSDVLALMAKKSAAPALQSARLLLLASPERQPLLKAHLATVNGYTMEMHANGYAAAASISAQPPAAIIVDIAQAMTDQTGLMHFLATSPELARTKVIVVGDRGAVDFTSVRLQFVQPEQLADAVGTALEDADAQIVSLPDDASFPIVPNEGLRLAALQRSGLLDAGHEEAFDELAWLARRSLRTPIALLTLLTSQHQVFKARYGIELAETPRSWAFCNYTILQREPFVVSDLSQDQRFASNPAVMGDFHFRFYAGAPVIDPGGFAVGSLCVIDREPRTLDAEQERTLRILAKLASDQIRLRIPPRPITARS